jgi:hypothetical protein
MEKFKTYSIAIPLLLFLDGTIMQLIFGKFPINSFRFPVNFTLIFALLIILALVFIFYKTKTIVKFLSSGYAALSSILFFIFHVIIMVIFSQNDHYSGFWGAIGFHKITETWSYAYSSLYLLLSLGMVSFRRLTPFNTRNIFFYFNHFGLWIVIAFASLGQADKLKLFISVPENDIVWFGTDSDGNFHEIDFAIKLNKFNLAFYSPQLAIMNDSGELLKVKEFHPLNFIKGTEIKYKDFNLKCLDLYEDAIIFKDSVVFIEDLPEKTWLGTVEISNKSRKDTVYLSTATSFHPPKIEKLGKNLNLILLPSEASYFGSKIEIYTEKDSKPGKFIIEVNKPLKLGNWTIYQNSYKKNPGNVNYISIFSAVYDPWIKVVYVGIVMMLIGAIYLIFSRKKEINK